MAGNFRYFLIACLAWTASTVAGMQPASAQTYNFALPGAGWSIASGLVTFSGNTVTAISGTASGLATQGIADGAFSWTTIGSSFSYLGSTTDYYVDVALTTGPTSPEIFFGDGGSFTTRCGGGPIPTCNRYGGAAASGVDIAGPPASNIFIATCWQACALTAASPAPVPGAGTLSWLALALGVVIVRRKAISATLRSAYSRIAARAST